MATTQIITGVDLDQLAEVLRKSGLDKKTINEHIRQMSEDIIAYDQLRMNGWQLSQAFLRHLGQLYQEMQKRGLSTTSFYKFIPTMSRSILIVADETDNMRGAFLADRSANTSSQPSGANSPPIPTKITPVPPGTAPSYPTSSSSRWLVVKDPITFKVEKTNVQISPTAHGPSADGLFTLGLKKSVAPNMTQESEARFRIAAATYLMDVLAFDAKKNGSPRPAGYRYGEEVDAPDRIKLSFRHSLDTLLQGSRGTPYEFMVKNRIESFLLEARRLGFDISDCVHLVRPEKLQEMQDKQRALHAKEDSDKSWNATHNPVSAHFVTGNNSNTPQPTHTATVRPG